MDILKIENILNSPYICFNPHTHLLEITGESYPENTREFYNPVVEWLRKYLEHLQDQTVTMNIELKYFNSSTAKILFNMFNLMNTAAGKGKNIIINWIFDKRNLNAVEYGEDFQEDLDAVRFNLEPK